jgi:cysteine desulfurase
VKKARSQVAELVGCDPEEIVFTSGGTEADNTAIFSAVEIFASRKHIVTSAVEHDAVLRYLAWLEETRGYEITKLGVNSDGQLDLDELRAAIRPGETALVSLMWGNNETGVIFPIPEAARIVSENDVIFHSDAVQAVGKVPVSLRETPISYLSLSGHKIHGPKGIGALYVNRNVPFRPWMLGGGQENSRRSGTENVAGIVGLGQAAEMARLQLEHPSLLRDRFETELRQRIPDVEVNGAASRRTPNTSNVRIPGTQAEGMMILLDQKGIAVSAGSACHTGALHPSHVLQAMRRSAEIARECLRISFSRFNTEGELATLLNTLESATRKMRGLLGYSG